MEGLKLVRENEPETNVMFWNYVREKVKSIEDMNIKLAFKDEIERRIKVFRGQTGGSFKKTLGRNIISSNFSFSKT